MTQPPERPSGPQLAFGFVFLCALTALALYWSADETSAGNRIFLWCIAGMTFLLALSRLVVAASLVRERRLREPLARPRRR